jgi:hypothetical protein
MGSSYREDIEGLRAVAVLPVVAFHIGLSVVPGGFVGVDIFFVISGFLITQLLVADMEADRFTLLRFYERRVRRILPALMCMLGIVCVLAWRYCLPDELADFAKSLIAASLSASNFYFWATSGYFDGSAFAKPLLHTWSLAVEEQFYLLWPLFLVVGRRYFRTHLAAVIAGISVFSLVIAAISVFNWPLATFYSPLTRLWELSLGGALAVGILPSLVAPRARTAVAAIGLVPADFAQLRQKTLINATGYGSRALFNDQSITPVRGQLARMIPQVEINYGLFHKGVSFVPRRDGLVFQAVGEDDYYGFDDDTTTPNRAEAELAVNTIADLFKTTEKQGRFEPPASCAMKWSTSACEGR